MSGLRNLVGAWDWRALKRIRVQLWMIALGAGTVGVSDVYAAAASGQDPFNPFPAVVAMCSVLVAIVGLLTAWVKRMEKRGLRQQGNATTPANGERFGRVEGALEHMDEHWGDLQKLVIDHRVETVREIEGVKKDVTGAVNSLKETMLNELQGMEKRQAERSQVIADNVKVTNFQVRNVQERVSKLEARSAA